MRTPYDGKILEIVCDMTFGKLEDGRGTVSYRITGLQLVPELYSASDPARRLVVRRVDNRQEVATYQTSVAEAQLIITRGGRP